MNFSFALFTLHALINASVYFSSACKYKFFDSAYEAVLTPLSAESFLSTATKDSIVFAEIIGESFSLLPSGFLSLAGAMSKTTF